MCWYPLSEILAPVDQHCGMFEEFRHWQQVNVDQTPSTAITIAGIMGLGCAIGIEKMARISRDVSEREPEYAVNGRFSLETIVAANDRVVAAMERMELPQIHRRSRETLHTSSGRPEIRGSQTLAQRQPFIQGLWPGTGRQRLHLHR